MKKILLIILAILIAIGAFLAKGYYNDRYVTDDIYYTQIPEDEKNEDSWLYDDSGVKMDKGKEYKLIGYNKDGKKTNLEFSIVGEKENYFKPGTYLEVRKSKTIVLGEKNIQKELIPEKALISIMKDGTKEQNH